MSSNLLSLLDKCRMDKATKVIEAPGLVVLKTDTWHHMGWVDHIVPRLGTSITLEASSLRNAS